MPKDTNPLGDIFGGWIISQMDLAGAIFAQKHVNGRVVTAAIDSITFKNPVKVGDTVSVYVEIIKQGTTSITVHIDTRVCRDNTSTLVTHGNFTYVKINKNNKPVAINYY